MEPRMTTRVVCIALAIFAAACGGGAAPNPHTDPYVGPSAGNPTGTCAIPADAHLADVTTPTHVIGDGTPESCTSAAVVSAVALGGVITFACGADPLIITLEATAKIRNDTGPEIVIDGGGLITLSGAGARRILYMNTCDQAQVWTTSHCDDQDHPRLTVQNLTFIDGNANGAAPEGGGGAIFVRGGRIKVINSRFFHNQSAPTGPDVGGGAIRVFDQSNDLPVYVVHSTFGGSEELGNFGSNGGALSSIGVSYAVINSLLTYNRAIGWGQNPTLPGTPGGGSGGAIYNDGNTFTLRVCGSEIANNSAVEGGGAIFFVSNDRTGSLYLDSSTLRTNPSMGFETANYPGIFVLADGAPHVSNSTLE